MNIKEQIQVLLSNLAALDMRKKIALGVSLIVTMVAVIFISTQFNKPATAPLYSNLSREDMNAMSRVLSENGIEFLALSENGSIEVPPELTAQARMLLAERGLPSSQESGYELFDRVNTLGLTSFMQDVTNKRAIEGELVRTIMMISGVNSARVHLVMPDKNVFRRNRSAPPSASVVLKAYGSLPGRSTNAIRHMVAAAVPGLETGNVTIVGSDGTLLTSKDDAIGGSSRLVELENEFELEARNKIAAALGAHLGGENLRISVTAKLNSDKRRIDETVYNPDSRVERSVQVVREAGSTENKETASPTTIDQNLPDEDAPAGSGQSSLENSERREELTNYEINEKRISTVSDGYVIEKMSVALVVNKLRLLELLGSNPDQAAIDAKISELTEIVKSSASISDERGDVVTVNLVEFMPVESEVAAGGGMGMMEFAAMHFGAILNVFGLITASIIFALFGIRPLLAFLSKGDGSEAPASPPMLGSNPDIEIDPDLLSNPDLLGGMDSFELPSGDAPANGGLMPGPGGDMSGFNPGGIGGAPALPGQGGFGQGAQRTPDMELEHMENEEQRIREQLGRMIEKSEDRAAMAIKQWLKEDRVKPA